MVKKRKEKKTPLTSWDKVPVICLVISLILNTVFGYLNYKSKVENSILEKKLKLQENEPHLNQDYLILRADTLKNLMNIGAPKITIPNAPNYEFVETELGAKIYKLIDDERYNPAFEPAYITFISLRNLGKSHAQDVKLVTSKLDKELSIGNIYPEKIQQCPVSFLHALHA